MTWGKPRGWGVCVWLSFPEDLLGSGPELSALHPSRHLILSQGGLGETKWMRVHMCVPVGASVCVCICVSACISISVHVRFWAGTDFWAMNAQVGSTNH